MKFLIYLIFVSNRTKGIITVASYFTSKILYFFNSNIFKIIICAIIKIRQSSLVLYITIRNTYDHSLTSTCHKNSIGI